jgi:hypothetical protein
MFITLTPVASRPCDTGRCSACRRPAAER